MICANTLPITVCRTGKMEYLLQVDYRKCVRRGVRQLCDTLTGIARYEYRMLNKPINHSTPDHRQILNTICSTAEHSTNWMPITQSIFGVLAENFFNKIRVEPIYADVVLLTLSFVVIKHQSNICVTKAINQSAQPQICTAPKYCCCKRSS